MQAVPWKKVFEWLADQTGQPVLANEVPTGAFTFVAPGGKAPRTFTLPEVIDLLNEALLAKRFMLVRRPASLLLVSAEEPLDAALSPLVRPDELSARGKTEVVRVVLPVDAAHAKEVLTAVKSMQGPFGHVLPVGKQLVVRDTVANLRQIVRLVQEVAPAEAPPAASASYTCRFVKAADARQVLEEIFGRGRLSIAADDRTNTLHLRGSPEGIAEAKSILARLDVPGKEKPIISDPSVLKFFTVPSGQAEVLARTLQGLYRGSSTVRITAIGADRILVYGGPEDQIAIARHLQEVMPTTFFEVLPLTTLDPSRTADVLRLMFSPGPGGRGRGPIIEADTSRNALLVRGTREQVEEIRMALRALGEAGAPAGGARVIRLERGDAATVAEALQELLPKLRPNPVRVIVPGGKAEPGPKRPGPGKEKAGPGAKKVAGKAPPPVTVIATGNRLVVTCDDPQVLALVQELVRAISAPQEGGLEVIPLRYSKAADVARVLDETFNGRPGPGPRLERVRIVADPSNNALLVRATPLDLLTIRRLLAKTLDVSSAEEAGGPRTWVLGPLRHARAGELAKVLREVYGEKSVTIGVDPRTNTLILRGPAGTYEDARKLVERLDTPAGKKD
jgi:type II secretory pathway component GspD/PulD (secretin)